MLTLYYGVCYKYVHRGYTRYDRLKRPAPDGWGDERGRGSEMQVQMKVQLWRERDAWHAPGATTVHLTSSLPFFYSPMASRAHRIKSGRLHYWEGQYTHTSFSLWCGQQGCISPRKRGQTMTDPPMPICGTCEGRATGAGQLESRIITGRFVVFAPRI
jgi:hypothetical protein